MICRCEIQKQIYQPFLCYLKQRKNPALLLVIKNMRLSFKMFKWLWQHQAGW